MNIAHRNRVLAGSLLAVLVFWVLVQTVSINMLIIIFNGVFFGCMAAILVAFGPLLWNTVKGGGNYDRVMQMTLGFFLCWVAYVLSSYTSVYTRSAGYPPLLPNVATVASRYVAVLSAVLQVTAPDFGLGIFHGRDRKTLWSGFGVGLVVALVLIFAQDQEWLSPYVELEPKQLPLNFCPAQP